MADLRECPFCGHGAREMIEDTPYFTEQWVECVMCEASTARVEGPARTTTAAPLWNRRETRALNSEADDG